ncbi:MAG: hypothetical protein WD904_09000 [Dehalococcoidia bacterium]
MATDSTRFSTFGRGWRWLNRAGIAVPLAIGLVLVAMVAITAISPRYHSPTEVNAGSPDDYAVGEPRFFEEERFWLVNLPSGEFIALYDRDPITGCTVPWDKNYELMGRTGWFHDACSESTYDLTGACFKGPCVVGLNRLDIETRDGELIVDPNHGPGGVFRRDNVDPVNPRQ